MNSIKYFIIFLNILLLVKSDIPIKGSSVAARRGQNKPPGIFHRFLRDFLTMLVTAIPEKNLPSYSRTLHQYVNELEYSYTKKLAKKIRKISRMHRDEIREEYQEYLDILNEENQPRKLDFLEAMDDVFRAQQEQQFRDYIEDMLEYGRGDKRDLEDETRKLIHDVIHNNILKRGKYNLRDLEKKLKRAIKELRYSRRSGIRRRSLRTHRPHLPEHKTPMAQDIEANPPNLSPTRTTPSFIK